MPTPLFLIIVGSVRPQRIGPDVAAWVAAIGWEMSAAVFETIDLRDWPLPMDAEPGIPAQGHYEAPTTKAWSEKIKGADG